MAQVLDAEKAERKVWVVKVPPYVAQRWHEALARSRQADVDDDAAEVLGQITVDQAGQAKVLHLPGDAEHPQGSVLHMNPNRDSVETSILSFELAATGSLQGPKVDGVVHKRYDAAPVNLSDSTAPGADGAVDGLEAGAGLLQRGPGRPQAAGLCCRLGTSTDAPLFFNQVGQAVDPAYLQNSRKRLAAAAAKPTARKVVLIDDVKTAQQLEGVRSVSIWSQKRDDKQKKKPEAREDRRRVRMARNELEEALCNQFKKQPHWHFMALQKELEQPAAYLKEVLNELGTQVKRGPFKDLWELKKHLAMGE